MNNNIGYTSSANRHFGLFFEISRTNKWLKTYYSNHIITLKTINGQENAKIRIFNVDSVLTAIDQTICLQLISLACEYATTDQITKNDVIDVIKVDKSFNYSFGKFLYCYDSVEPYYEHLNLRKKNILDFLSVCDIDKNYVIEDDALNFLMFIMLKNRIMVAETSFVLSQHAKKAMVNDRSVLFALKILYIDKLYQDIYENVNRIITLMQVLVTEFQKS